MTYNVFGGTLNPTHSLTQFIGLHVVNSHQNKFGLTNLWKQ